MKSELAAYVPHAVGVASAACAPPLKESSNRERQLRPGSCGALERRRDLPRRFVEVHLPGSFRLTPSPDAATNSFNSAGRTQDVHVAFNGFGKSGVDLIVPTFDADGHDCGPSNASFSPPSTGRPSSSGGRATKPVACPGLIAIPSGNRTVVSFNPDVASPSGFKPAGTPTVAVNPAGESEELVSGAKLIDG